MGLGRLTEDIRHDLAFTNDSSRIWSYNLRLPDVNLDFVVESRISRCNQDFIVESMISDVNLDLVVESMISRCNQEM